MAEARDPDATNVSGAPELGPPETVACLRVLAGGDVGRVFRLHRGETSIGRSEAADVRIEDDGVSRHHAKIQLFPGEPPRVLDLSSMNGTFVNGEKADHVTLHEGDRLQVGRGTVFVFTSQEAVDDAYAQRFYDQATRDPVTGIHSLRYFRERLRAEFSYAAREGEAPLAVLALEVREDGPAAIGDRDALARHVAEALTGAVRAEDLLARQNALTFVVLSRSNNSVGLRQFAQRLLRFIEGAPFSGGALQGVCGIASYERGGYREPEDLWRAAEFRLSLARATGPGTIEGPST